MRCDLNITTCRAHANIVVVDLNKIQNASESSSCLENIAAACCCSTGAPRYVTISSPPKQPRHQNSHPPFQNDFCTYHVKSCHIVPLVCFLHRSLILVLRRALVLALRCPACAFSADVMDAGERISALRLLSVDFSCLVSSCRAVCIADAGEGISVPLLPSALLFSFAAVCIAEAGEKIGSLRLLSASLSAARFPSAAVGIADAGEGICVPLSPSALFFQLRCR